MREYEAEKSEPSVTVFTPIYNRASYLPAIFSSLKGQTCMDFEWIVVDDGSTDRPEKTIRSLEATGSPFPIFFYHKGNGGKHTAVNMGVRKANGSLFLIVDSDDELPPNSIQDILEQYKKIESDDKYGGVCGYMAHRNGSIIGIPFVSQDCDSLSLRYRLRVSGDMCEVFRTSVLKDFPFPETKNERFCPESLIWNRIAQKYKLRVFSKKIYLRDYLKGGLTDNIIRVRMQSPINTMTTYQEMTTYNLPWSVKVKAAINYWRFRFCLQGYYKQCFPRIGKRWLILSLLGFFLHLNDLRLCK